LLSYHIPYKTGVIIECQECVNSGIIECQEYVNSRIIECQEYVNSVIIECQECDNSVIIEWIHVSVSSLPHGNVNKYSGNMSAGPFFPIREAHSSWLIKPFLCEFSSHTYYIVIPYHVFTWNMWKAKKKQQHCPFTWVSLIEI
jgi:hypothetical protein